MKCRALTLLAVVPFLMIGLACTNQHSVSYKDSVKNALEQADLKDVSVSEDAERNTITLNGTVHSEDAKQKAADVAKASAGSRIVVDQLSVQPVGMESEAKSIASNVDDGIESNYKAALISKGLDKQRIHFDSKNGVLKLTGSVKTPGQRSEAEQLAKATPNVEQVVNEIDVRR